MRCLKCNGEEFTTKLQLVMSLAEPKVREWYGYLCKGCDYTKQIYTVDFFDMSHWRKDMKAGAKLPEPICV